MSPAIRLLVLVLAVPCVAQVAPVRHWGLDSNLVESFTTGAATPNGTIGFTNGSIGLAAVFSNSYADPGYRIHTNAYTKSAWVMRFAGGNNNILSGDTSTNRHALFVPSSSSYRLSAGHNSVWNSVEDSESLPSNTWFHVAVTYDASESGGTLRLYRNGRPVSGKPVATNIPPPNGGRLLLGGYNYVVGNGWLGRLDDLAIWDRALSADEVAQLYRTGAHNVEARDAGTYRDPVFSLVPEATNYVLVYDHNPTNSLSAGTTGQIDYVWNGSAALTNERTFDRIAYYLELWTNNATSARWVYVSMDAFTRRPGLIGVPVYANGGLFQQRLTNVNIHSSDPALFSETNSQGCNLEFWGLNYTTNNSAGVPNASGHFYDAGDEPSTSGTFGSMQIHRHSGSGLSTSQTLFAYNAWGSSSIDELGIGNRPASLNSDWTFAANVGTYTSSSLLVLVRPLIAPQISLTSAPSNLQLYPRDRTSNRATVDVAGAISSTGCTALVLQIDDPLMGTTQMVQSLNGTIGESFSFRYPITSGLHAYDFTIFLERGGVTHTVYTAEGVVAGDVVLVSGQSNAEARQFSGSGNSNRSFYVRSFGYRTSSGTTVAADLQWYLAEGDAIQGGGAIGQWALRMARLITESNGVPLAVINHAEGGQPITFFRCIDSDRESLTVNYGQMLYRTRRAGLDRAVRAVLWFQGESDGSDLTSHKQGFTQLTQDWLSDFPSIERLYVVQLRYACGSGPNNLSIREYQRSLPDEDPRFTVLSTSGLPSHTDNCHYAYENGYRVLGEQAARLLLRDLYGFAFTSEIAAPNPGHAWIADPSGSTIALRTRNPADQLDMKSGMQTNFLLAGFTNATLLSTVVTGNEVRLVFDRDVRSATGLSYIGQAGGGPYITNALGLGLLYFQNLPIAQALQVPSPPTGLRAWSMGSNRIELAWTPVSGVGEYEVQRDGSTAHRTHLEFYTDTGRSTGVLYGYRVRAINAAGTSSWSATIHTSTVAHSVYRQAADAADYEVLYALEIPDNAVYGSTLKAAYEIDESTRWTAGVRRVAYHLELQDAAGVEPRWVYTSMNAFTTDASRLGVPTIAAGGSFQQFVTNLHVLASPSAGVTGGYGLTSGTIEFWGYNYSAANSALFPNASSTLYDHGDANGAPVGTYGSMQVHLHDVDAEGPATNGMTLWAWNRWGYGGVGDLGIGDDTNRLRLNWSPDYTFATNAQSYRWKRMTILVQLDEDQDGLPDTWERRCFGDTTRSADVDDDGDGLSNADELTAGSNPADPSSFPEILITSTNGGELRVPTLPGRGYYVETADAYAPEWQTVDAPFAGDGSWVARPAIETNAQRLYRVRISRP